MKQLFKIFCIILLSISTCNNVIAGRNETKRVTVGDIITLNTTMKYYTYAITWFYDTGILQPQGPIYETSTSVSFKVLKETPDTGITVEAITYYYKDGTTSSGIMREIDYWKIFATDNSTVSISPSTVTLNTGGRATITANPSNSSYSGSYTWDSQYPNVAYVSGNGRTVTVVSKSSGYTPITVTLSNGQSATCGVTVKDVEPTDISISSTLTAYVGENASVDYSLYPSNAQTTLSWYSRDTYIATVSGGSVYGKEEGMTAVYCRTSNGLTSNDCKVTVKYRVPTGIKVSESTLYVPLGQSKQLKGTVTPSNAKYTLKWTSEDDNIASVNQNGLVTSVSAGQTRIKVETNNGYSAYCDVTVPPNPDQILLPKNMLLLYGKARKLKHTLLPEDSYEKLTWKSSETSVAQVSSEGVVTALAPGRAVISVTTHNGKSAECQVEIPEPDYRFCVWMSDGDMISYPLSNHPKVSYLDEILLLRSDNGISAEFLYG